MASIEHKGKSYEVDEDGFLLKGQEEWDENWVDYVKTVEGIAEITDEHQKVIDALQEYYKKNGIAPMVRILSKTTGFPLKRIYELFPSGPGKGACKMAGLPKPTGCVHQRTCKGRPQGRPFFVRANRRRPC
jgi:tRNA 2-thiouridine synthesizing protein E